MRILKHDEKEDWVNAGKIAASIFKKVASLIKPGQKLLAICELIENEIKKAGGKPAFPPNISVNNIAAHYTCPPRDASKIPATALVKVDIGVSINGAIADTAQTFLVGGNRKLYRIVKAAQRTLNEAIELIRAGITVREISEKIWLTSHEMGFGVLTDLGGHEIRRGILHAGLFIPNSPSTVRKNRKISAGAILAIEPFLVLSYNDSETIPVQKAKYIFSLARKIDNTKDDFLKMLYEKYGLLPFALRWIMGSSAISKGKVKKMQTVLDTYEKRRLIHSYPVLVDKNGYWVAQFEHTLRVKKSSVEVLTIL